jgi:peroxiredoxin
MKNLKLTLLLFLSGTLFYSFVQIASVSGFKNGQKAPLIEEQMQNIDKTMHSLSALKQENGLVVVFSCNTCPFVVGNASFPGWERTYNDLHKQAQAAKMGMVLINSNAAKRGDDDSFEAMQQHAKAQGYTMPYLLDADAKLANAFEAKTTPHVYVLDKDLKLVYQGSVDNTWDPKRSSDVPYLTNAITSVAKGEKVQEDATPPRGCSIKRVQ